MEDRRAAVSAQLDALTERELRALSIVDHRMQTGELPLAETLGIVTGTGAFPENAFGALELAAWERALTLVELWPTPLYGERESPGKPVADCLPSGIRLTAGPVTSAGRPMETEAGWVAIGPLSAVSGRLRWDDEPR